MAERSYVRRAFLAGSRYGYKRGYRDGEADVQRELEDLMGAMRAEITATRRLRALHEVDEDTVVDPPKTPLN